MEMSMLGMIVGTSIELLILAEGTQILLVTPMPPWSLHLQFEF